MSELSEALDGTVRCFVLPCQSDDGPANMALDEALFEDVAANPGTAYLRTYGWTVPTLTLGYFQRIAELDADPRFRDAALVRRLTGGGAIWHDHELTYALVIPADHPLARPSSRLYQAVHGAIAGALRENGVAVARRGQEVASKHRDRKRPLLCFTDTDAEDIVAEEVKVVGSARRRRGGAVLQHGSLLLSRSGRTPELPGIGDVADITLDRGHWSIELVDRILRALGLERIDIEIPPRVRREPRNCERPAIRRRPGRTCVEGPCITDKISQSSTNSQGGAARSAMESVEISASVTK